ncbi:hypothetical protein ES677_09615 [Bizionia gelidisalsuginis]|uniref:Uncharacterized protein n=1 Tax=Bizionia gelidisalsuginis TaxID=291188 RepID=A0ABY3M9T7_9FLAO|nr:hypothetical protein [Bizionia gelidisalsuginis]TYC12014.1 hypothetical protein ES677_09615 [Bizionia gelidisalsuginis]
MKKTILIIAVFAFNLSLFGQIDKPTLEDSTPFSSKERTVLQTNADFVIAGEYLYYKLFTIDNNTLSTISKVGYVELVNAKKDVILQHKIKLIDGVGYSDFFIPSTVLTGMYKIVGYTNFSKNNINESYFAKDIFIVNPFTANSQKVQDSLKTTATLNLRDAFPTENITHPLLSISTQKKEYSQRELISVNTEINDRIKSGNYSVSIRKLDSIEALNPISKNYVSVTSSDTLYIPEMRGELISGKITNTVNTLDVSSKYVALSLPGKDYTFKVAKTNSNGAFFFNLNENSISHRAIIQVIEKNKEDFKVQLQSLSSNNYNALSFANLNIDSKLKQTIEARNIQNQIENAYYEEKRDSILPTAGPQLFYDGLGIKHELNAYTRFKTVRETFIEIVNQAGLRQNSDGTHRFVVYDNVLNYDLISSNLEPLLLVDGIIIQNNNDVVFYDSKKIKSITVVQGQYIYGSKVFEGIIDIETIAQDFKTSIKGAFFIEKDLKKLEPQKKYFQPEYSNTTLLNNRIPDYRRQLLWVPEISKNETQFKAYTSDVKGVFEVKLEGLNNLGTFISTSTFIEVK